MTSTHLSLSVLLFACSLAAMGQDAPQVQPGQIAKDPPPPDKRVFGVLPNYRTANETAVYMPITAKQKFTIASKDSFDYPLLGLAAFIAAYGQLDNAHPEFGQGWAGYGRRVGTSYADQAIGNMMTEGIFPSLLHEDPRYFRRGHGSVWSRTVYAASRVLITRTDSGARASISRKSLVMPPALPFQTRTIPITAMSPTMWKSSDRRLGSTPRRKC